MFQKEQQNRAKVLMEFAYLFVKAKFAPNKITGYFLLLSFILSFRFLKFSSIFASLLNHPVHFPRLLSISKLTFSSFTFSTFLFHLPICSSSFFFFSIFPTFFPLSFTLFHIVTPLPSSDSHFLRNATLNHNERKRTRSIFPKFTRA